MELVDVDMPINDLKEEEGVKLDVAGTIIDGGQSRTSTDNIQVKLLSFITFSTWVVDFIVGSIFYDIISSMFHVRLCGYKFTAREQK